MQKPYRRPAISSRGAAAAAGSDEASFFRECVAPNLPRLPRLDVEPLTAVLEVQRSSIWCPRGIPDCLSSSDSCQALVTSDRGSDTSRSNSLDDNILYAMASELLAFERYAL